MSIDLQQEAKQLKRIMSEYADNNKKLEELRLRNDRINVLIRETYERIRATPLNVDIEPPLDTGALTGHRCFKCNRIARYRCFWCFVADKPSGYCDNHTHIHRKEFPDHSAIFQPLIFKSIKKEHIPREKLTDEQQLERLEAEAKALREKLGYV